MFPVFSRLSVNFRGFVWDCSWIVHGLFMDCSWIVHGLFMDCSWIVHGLFMVSSWFCLICGAPVNFFMNFVFLCGAPVNFSWILSYFAAPLGFFVDFVLFCSAAMDSNEGRVCIHTGLACWGSIFASHSSISNVGSLSVGGRGLPGEHHARGSRKFTWWFHHV